MQLGFFMMPWGVKIGCHEFEVMDNFVYSHHNMAFAFIGIKE